MNKYTVIIGLVFLGWLGYSVTHDVQAGLNKADNSVSAYRTRLEKGE